MDIEEKMKQIDIILSDDTALNLYLKNIEKMDIYVDNKLQERIFNKVKDKKHEKISIYNILKIAACMIFSIAIWRLVNITNENVNFIDKSYNSAEIYMNLEHKLDEINAFMMSPKIFEGGKK